MIKEDTNFWTAKLAALIYVAAGGCVGRVYKLNQVDNGTKEREKPLTQRPRWSLSSDFGNIQRFARLSSLVKALLSIPRCLDSGLDNGHVQSR